MSDFRIRDTEGTEKKRGEEEELSVGSPSQHSVDRLACEWYTRACLQTRLIECMLPAYEQRRLD
jgi:hypothetical protein